MDRANQFRDRARLNKPPPPAPLYAPEPRPSFPRWAQLALNRGDEAPGHYEPMWARWYDVCPQCGACVFLVHPFLMPAFEEVVSAGGELDLLRWGPRSLNRPENPIKHHAHRYFADSRECDWETLTLITQGLKESDH